MPTPGEEEEDLETRASGSGEPSEPDPDAPPPSSLGEDDATLASIPTGPQATTPGTPGGTEAPTGEPSEGGPLDLVSLPPRPKPRSVPAPGTSYGTRPSSSQPSASRPPLPPGVTRPGPAPDDVSEEDAHRATELPAQRDVHPRHVETQAGAFGSVPRDADRTEPAAGADEEEATVADAGLTGRQKALLDRERAAGPSDAGAHAPTAHDQAGGTAATPKAHGPVPASKYSRGTARDPIAGTGAGPGSAPGSRHAPTLLKEGALLADRYELIKRLGKGGMGEVWQAKHTLLQGMRAIKVIKAAISRDPSFRARFLSEGQTMMRVKHPGVVEVTDLDETRQNRELFMVMEFLQGRTVHAAVRDQAAPLAADPRNAARIFRLLADGMQRIHDERIVHKDLKTDNVVLVTGDDGLELPKVIDFGLAKRLGEKDEVRPAAPSDDSAVHHDPDVHHEADTRTTLSGTLAYMAPEQFLGEPSSFRSDIYAFGVMLYECFTRGDYPMPRGPLGDYLKRHKAGEVAKRLRMARPDLDPFLADLADRCMASRLEQRPESFREVAGQIQWWLDAPIRAARRKQRIYVASAATFLIAVAVWGVFFQKQAAGVGAVQLRPTAEGPIFVQDAREGRFRIGEAAVASVHVEAAVTGETGVPSVEVDGTEHAAQFEFQKDGGRVLLVGTIDLSDVADGPHTLGFRASAGTDPQQVRVAVDRRGPLVQSVELAGAAGSFTKSASPTFRVATDDPPHLVREITARVAGSDQVKSATRDGGDGGAWEISGISVPDGDAKIEVRATDIAGNASKPVEFAFHTDTHAPAIDVESADGIVPNAGAAKDALQVRDASGNRVTVRCGEDVTMRAAFQRAGASVPETRDLPSAPQFDVALPVVPPEGLTMTLVATDRAGNETTRSIAVREVEDVVTLRPADGGAEFVVTRPDAMALLVRRPYPLRDTLAVWYAPISDADGRPAADTSGRELAGADVTIDPLKPTDGEIRLPAGLPAGRYGVSVTGLAGAKSSSIEVVVDPDAPEVGAITVRDADGNEVPTTKWCRTRDITVSAVVTDLSLRSVTLQPGDIAPSETDPGTGMHVFRMQLAAEGRTTLRIVAKDAAKHESSPVVEIRCDWTRPVVTLETPASGSKVNDVDNVAFAGTCSEDDYTLVVTGAKGGEFRTKPPTREFSVERVLDRGEGAVAGVPVTRTVSVVAIDRAEWTSEPESVTLEVQHVAKELPDDWTWKGPLAAHMKQIRPGDVVIEGRTQPVAHCFVDLTEVTNRQYRLFVAACAPHAGKKAPWDHPEQPAAWSHVPAAETWSDPKWNADDLPVVNVAWWDAWAFAKWSGRRLPTEAEWVKAAAKDPRELELRSWPPIAEGKPWEEGRLATAESTQQKGPVDATKGTDVSPSGCLHMGGNVSEWVDIPYARAGELPTGVRGGSFWTSRFGADVRRVPTKPYDRSFRARTIGFRCAVDASAVQP